MVRDDVKATAPDARPRSQLDEVVFVSPLRVLDVSDKRPGQRSQVPLLLFPHVSRPVSGAVRVSGKRRVGAHRLTTGSSIADLRHLRRPTSRRGRTAVRVDRHEDPDPGRGVVSVELLADVVDGVAGCFLAAHLRMAAYDGEVDHRPVAEGSEPLADREKNVHDRPVAAPAASGKVQPTVCRVQRSMAVERPHNIYKLDVSVWLCIRRNTEHFSRTALCS